MELSTRVRKWGSSLAVILPKNLVEAQKIHENDELKLLIKKRPLAGELFGKFPHWSKPTQKIKDEMREGWRN